MNKHNSYLKVATLFLLFLTQSIVKVKAGDDNTTGVHFRSITFEQALTVAKAENKPIFIHGFADWCHYCVYMKDSVYTDKEVGDFYNEHFVCIKLDMEKEGKELNKTIKSHTFPTFLEALREDMPSDSATRPTSSGPALPMVS